MMVLTEYRTESDVHICASELGWLVLLLRSAEFYRDPSPGRDRVDGLTHALQAATRAEREGATEDEVVMALIHDAARPLTDLRYGEVIAEIMAARLPSNHVQALRTHGSFQHDIITKNDFASYLYRDAPWLDKAQRLARWDAASFDPDYPHEPLDHFIPMLQRLYR